MRYSVILVILLAVFIMPASAQTTFQQGQYDFEDVIASMTYSGTWTTVTVASPYVLGRQTASGNVSFLVEGKTLVIWRFVAANTVASRMDVCVGASCVSVINESTAPSGFWYPFEITLAAGTNTVTITRTLGTITLDYFMILNDPAVAGGMPTAVPTVPTATILPSSTPAFTATPGDTPVPTATILPSSTPAPTATPYTLPGAIFAIDPAARYSSSNGQITATRYEMAAPDYLTVFLLATLVAVNVFQVGLTLWKRK